MKFVIAYAIGFVAVLFLAGFTNILFSFIVLATQYMTKTTFALLWAAVGGIIGMVLLWWLDHPKT